MHKHIIKKNLTEKNIVRTLEQKGNEVFDAKKTKYRQEFEVYQIKYKDTDTYSMGYNVYNIVYNRLNAYHEKISYVNRTIMAQNLFKIDKEVLGKSKNEVLGYLIEKELIKLPYFIDSECTGKEFIDEYENIVKKSKLDKVAAKRKDLKIPRIIELINAADEVIKVMISEYDDVEE